MEIGLEDPGEGGQKWSGQKKDQVKYLKREIHFIVESPTGEQMPMRYKPEMTFGTLFQIACKKFGLQPNDYYVVFNYREMDNSEFLKNVNITLSSVVKIYKGRKITMIPDIFASVRIKDCRIGSVFRMTDNLWDILYKLLSDKSYEPDMVPIVIYKKNEFIGEKVLKEVRLRDMGVTQGSCVVRFIQLRQEDLDDRKMKEDEDTLATLESLELKNIGTTGDTGGKTVHFKLDEDELDQENIQFIGERRTLAFRLPDQSTPEELLQEEFFDLLVDEIQPLFQELSRRKGVAKNDLNDAVRAELGKLAGIRTDFDDTLVRVGFPDRTCIQSIFSTDERVSDVKAFIRKFLRNPDEDFDLYVLKGEERINVQDDTTLNNLKLIPAVRLIFEPLEHRFTSMDQFLCDEVMISLTPYNIGKEAALMLRGESLDRFLMSAEDNRNSLRKSTGSFLNKFLRTSHSSTHRGTTTISRGFDGSRAYSRAVGLSRKVSSFGGVKKNLSRGSSGRTSSDDDETESADLKGSKGIDFRESSSMGVGRKSIYMKRSNEEE